MKLLGLLLYAALSMIGAAILAGFFVVPTLLSDEPELGFGAIQVGALLALPPLVIYLWAPRMVGRLAPEPWWHLLVALGFGAFAASGFSALFNTLVESRLVEALSENGQRAELAYALSVCLAAPIVEEAWKGLAVLFGFWLFRRGLDSVTDGVVYAIFSALGFATIENVIFYSRAAYEEVAGDQEGALAMAFVVRGVLSPWMHPLYTSLFGLGLGISRETMNPHIRRLAPVIGYLLAILLHAVWNGAAILSGDFDDILLPLGLGYMALFVALFAALAWRHGRILRQSLEAEVVRGTLTEGELRRVLSPWGRLGLIFRGASFGERESSRRIGGVEKDFIATAARLGFHEWHASRGSPYFQAGRDQREESSESLRLELGRLRASMQSMRQAALSR